MAVKLSLVVSVRDAGSEVDEFLRSLSHQAPGDYSAEVIVVPFAAVATDRSLTRAIKRAAVPATIVSASTPNVARARRAGLAHATGEWVSFPHGTDVLDHGYLRAVAEAISSDGGRSVAYLASRTSVSVQRTGGGRRVRPSPDAPLTGVPTEVIRTFYRRTAASEQGLALDEVGDPLLVAELVSAHRHAGPVTLVPAARYGRRPLRGADPATQWFRADSGRYVDLVDAHARLLSRGAEGGARPRWYQELALRDVRKLLAFEFATARRATALDGSSGALFRERLGLLLREIDEELIARRSAAGALDEREDILMAMRGSTLASAGHAHVVAGDARSGMMEVRYSILDGDADEVFRQAGRVIAPAHGKIRSLEVFGQERVTQRIAWVPASADLELEVSGRRLAISLRSGSPVPSSVEDIVRAIAENRSAAASIPKDASQPSRSISGHARDALRLARRSWLSKAALVRLSSRLSWTRRRYRQAWTFMDRADAGQDNAEHMYRWVKQHHPTTNAWFVIRGDVPDFRRLRAEGFRVVRYGTIAHQQLLYNTRHYLSSHVGIDVSRPVFDRYLLADAPWTFTFLQHGVIHNDLSIWLNNQRIDHFVTTTHGEYSGIAGDGTPYRFTDREVTLTGMPRLDRLRRIADAHPVAERRTIVFAPTWRNGLFEPPAKPGMRRMPKPGFADAPFIRSIVDALGHPILRRLASAGYDIRFVPHPNLAADFPYALLPDYATVSSYASTDVQLLLGSAAVFLTDYSSVAFDAAFADADVVYLHADAGVFGVDHTLFPGYFDFERDGFGPIGRTVDDALQAVEAAVAGRAPAVYRDRARRAFAFWDARSCERVYNMVIRNGA